MITIKKPGKRARQKEYKAYLASPYWQAVAAAVINRDRKCTKCGATKRLEVHHLSYAHRGQEHLYLQDLTTLCRSCHKQHHKQLKDAQKARRHGRFQTPKTPKTKSNRRLQTRKSV
ncbi:HNH endonuclease [Chroococcidiopsis sp.]|uniref:HNH endonuclease n=1 Tax=Chroococcidiopsis sp. TaxID=3088168 RepID=UPI003F2CF5D0